MSELLTFLLTKEAQFRKARVPSLWSDFRLQRTANPDGYLANLAAWEGGLAHAVEAGLIPGSVDVLSLRTGEVLLRALDTREWGRPLALAAVIDDAVSHGRMIPLADFLESPTSIYAPSWAIRPWWLVSWGLKKVGLKSDGTVRGSLQRGQYVLLHNVQEAANKVMSSLSSRQTQVDRLMPMKKFLQEAEGALGLDTRLTSDDASILLVHLSRDKNWLAYDKEVVKLRGAGEDVPRLTSVDKDIVCLKSLIIDLTKQLDGLNLKITELDQKARLAVTRKNRVAAIASLRSKKLQESVHLRRSETLAQMEGIYTKLEEAVDQVEVLRVMQTSTRVLKGLNDQVGGVETVEDVLDRLRTEMTQVEDVGVAIGDAAQETSIVDEGAVDDELEALEREDRARSDEIAAKETAEKLKQLEGLELPKLDIADTNPQVKIESLVSDAETGDPVPEKMNPLSSESEYQLWESESSEVEKRTEPIAG